MRARCSLLTEPWCARARTGGAPADGTGLGHHLRPVAPRWDALGRRRSPGVGPRSSSRSAQISFSRAVSRSASRRELAKTSVERWAAIRSTTRSSTCGQIEARGELARRGTGQVAGRLPELAQVGDRHDDPQVEPLVAGGLDDGDRLGRRPGTAPPPGTGRTVADSPIRWAGRSSRASRRSRVRARWAPRLVPATACTSSTITVSTPASDLARPGGEQQEQRLRSGDQHVGRRAGKGAALGRRSCRRSGSPTRISGSGSPRRTAACRMPVSGARRLRSTSTASAFIGET